MINQGLGRCLGFQQPAIQHFFTDHVLIGWNVFCFEPFLQTRRKVVIRSPTKHYDKVINHHKAWLVGGISQVMVCVVGMVAIVDMMVGIVGMMVDMMVGIVVGMVGIVGGMADTGFCQSALILCSTKFSLKKTSVLCEPCEVEMHPPLFSASGYSHY